MICPHCQSDSVYPVFSSHDSGDEESWICTNCEELIDGAEIQSALAILQLPPEELQAQVARELADDEEVEWNRVRILLQKVIESEDPSKPLTDEQLVERLHEEGLNFTLQAVRALRRKLGIADPDQRHKDPS